MSEATSQRVLNGVLDTYLVLGSVLVSVWILFVDLTVFETVLSVVILVGNLYWVIQFNSIARLNKLLSSIIGTSTTNNQPNTTASRLWHDPINQYPLKKSYLLQKPHQPLNTINPPQLLRKTSIIKRNQNKTGLPTDLPNENDLNSKQTLEYNPRNTPQSMSLLKKSYLSRLVSNKKKVVKRSGERVEGGEEELVKLQEEFEKEFERSKMRAGEYYGGMERTKRVMRARVRELIGRHFQNLDSFSEVLRKVFNITLSEPDGRGSAGQISLDRFLEMRTYDQKYQRLTWLQTNRKESVLRYLNELIQQREYLDSHILFDGTNGEPLDLQRQRGIETLQNITNFPTKLQDSMDQTHLHFSLEQQQIALFKVLQSLINTNLPLQLSKLKVRSRLLHTTKNPTPSNSNNQILFLFQKLKLGYLQINIESGGRVFNCQPGSQNIYSSIYFYFKEVRRTMISEKKECKVIDDILREVFN